MEDGVNRPDAGLLRGESGGKLDSEKGVGSSSVSVAEKGNGGAIRMDFEDGGGFDASAVKCPTLFFSFTMNFIIWNSRGVLKPNF